MKNEDLKSLVTETRNTATAHLDRMSIKEILQQINQEDQSVSTAISKALPEIEEAINLIVSSLKNDGRLIYIGAGTSGRLGVLDAAECVPTFGTDPNLVVGLIAGGSEALMKAIEGAEDSPELGIKDLEAIAINENDTVVGISASGRTPYVLGGLDFANKKGAATVAISCNRDSAISKAAIVGIEAIVGPEVLTGSTRMKAGTAQKLILNMLSTVSMIQIGKVYQNLMIDINVTNEKLKDRAARIVSDIAQISDDEASQLLKAADYQVKEAVVMYMKNMSFEEAKQELADNNGLVYKIIE